MGDFNLDLLKFELHKPTEEFIDAMFSFGLVPTITKPTRTQGNAATLIDNIFTSSVSMGISGILLNDISDHHMVFAIEEISTGSPEGNIKKPDMSTKNINAFCEILSRSSCDFIQEENYIIKAYDNFYSKITATAEILFPLKLVKAKKHTKFHG